MDVQYSNSLVVNIYVWVGTRVRYEYRQERHRFGTTFFLVSFYIHM